MLGGGYDVHGRTYQPQLLTMDSSSYLQVEEIIVKLILLKEYRSYILTVYHIWKAFKPKKILTTLINIYDNPKIEFDPPLSEDMIAKFLDDKNPTLESVTRENVIFLIKWWMLQGFDFFDFPELIQIQEQYVAENQNKLQANLSSQLAYFRAQLPIYESSVPHRYSDIPLQQNTFSFLSNKYGLKALVEQITLYEYDLIASIRFKEYLNERRKKENVNLNNYLSHFTRMKGAIISELTSHLGLLKKAIKFATLALKVNNFNLAMEICSALYSPDLICQERIKSWEALDDQTWIKFQQLGELLSSDDGYQRYKSALAAVKQFVPFIGVHIGDLRFIHQYNKSHSIYGINETKVILLSREFSNFALYPGASAYTFEPDNDCIGKISTYLDGVTHSDDSTLKQKVLLNIIESRKNDEDSRISYLLNRYEYFYNDSTMSGYVGYNFGEHQMRRRDWNVITSNSNDMLFNPAEIITMESREHIYILTEGTVQAVKEGITIKTLSPPYVLNYNDLLDVFSSVMYYAETSCKVKVMEKILLFSILRNSDPLLSVRFYMHVGNTLIEQLKRANIKYVKPINMSRRSGRIVTHATFLSSISTSNLIANKSKEKTLSRDEELKLIFDWQPDEIIIKECKVISIGRIDTSGTLFITKFALHFYGKLFSHKTKFSIPMDKIQSIRRSKQKVIIEYDKKYIFKILHGMEETLQLIEKLTKPNVVIHTPERFNRHGLRDSLRKRKVSSPYNDFGDTPNNNNIINNEQFIMNEEDWKTLLRGARLTRFVKGDVLIREGEKSQRIFQLSKGSCRIRNKSHGVSKEVGTIELNDIFGEMSFIQNNGASVSVIADSDDVEVFNIEGYYLQRLFQMRPELAGKFLQYICCIVGKRLGMRVFETYEERQIFDYIAPPVYSSLERIEIARTKQKTCIHVISGPIQDAVQQKANFIESATSYCAGSTISTYPMRSYGEGEKRVVVQDGSPICDQYKAKFFSNKIIAAVADGCNWGEAPREAATRARDAFVEYVSSHVDVMYNTQCAASLIQRAFSIAHAEILRGKNSMLEMIGTTTLMGGVIVKLEDYEDDDIHSTCAFIYGSLGDCKAFHWNSKTGVFSDITKDNRNLSLDASDCGGRLGPHMPGDMPDLRNFELGLFPCGEGDVFIIVSDGVHDNLDPKSLGFLPKELHLDVESWDSVGDLVAIEEVKTQFRLMALRKIIFKEADSWNLESFLSASPTSEKDYPFQNLPELKDVVSNLLEHCAAVCRASSRFMEENPCDPLPHDYKLYPGKMDHTTCLCFRVQHFASKDLKNENK